VSYLKRVYRGAPDTVIGAIERWGDEEIQHGLALGRWAGLVPIQAFDFKARSPDFARCTARRHFEHGEGSVRGSRRGEMISRCVVESGTSSLYSAIRDATPEPVLKEVAGRIAADEFRHYRLFLRPPAGRKRARPTLVAQALDRVQAGERIRRRRARLRLLLRQCTGRRGRSDAVPAPYRMLAPIRTRSRRFIGAITSSAWSRW
jgi:hypothetical protein